MAHTTLDLPFVPDNFAMRQEWISCHYLASENSVKLGDHGSTLYEIALGVQQDLLKACDFIAANSSHLGGEPLTEKSFIDFGAVLGSCPHRL